MVGGALHLGPQIYCWCTRGTDLHWVIYPLDMIFMLEESWTHDSARDTQFQFFLVIYLCWLSFCLLFELIWKVCLVYDYAGYMVYI